MHRIHSLIIRYFRSSPDPNLVWERHQENQLYSEFSEFIESRYEEVKRKSSIQKYYAKILFQVFIYCLNMLELIFTLHYKQYNQISETEGTFNSCYLLSIILCVLMHIAAWFYTHKFRQVAKMSLLSDFSFFLYYMIIGGLSYFKIAPFIYYFNRDESIRQFSFSEINKYLILSEDDKFRNPCMLFKQRTKPVNIFRDLIFHRVALLSMMITMTIQTIPQLFIQGLYNTYYQRWDDGFNVVSYLLLLSNLLYYITEFFFILFMTTYRQMKTALNLQFSKIKLYFIQETKQLLKSDLQYMGFVKSFYFHIDPSTFSNYQKKRCMVQIITFLKKYKQIQNVQFHFIDQYETVTLQYLANCFKLIQVERISLLYKDKGNLQMMQDIFQISQCPNLTLDLMQPSNLEQLWNEDYIDANAQRENEVTIQFIQNPKINAGWQVLKQSQRPTKDYIKLTEVFIEMTKQPLQQRNDLSKPQQLKTQSNEIVEESREIITQISKKVLLEEKVGRFTCLITLYNYFEILSNLNYYQEALQSIRSIVNGSFQIITIVYLTSDEDIFMSALIALNIVNPSLQMLSFILFQQQVFNHYTIGKKILNAILFGLFNFFKIWEGILIFLYVTMNQFTQDVQRDFSAEAYIKFKSYASKFKGSLAISVFQQKKAQVDTNNILEIKEQPFFQAIMWRASVEEALNKIPQFFLFILALTSNDVNILWFLSFITQIKDSIFAVKDILEVVIKDFFIPALILSKDSVEQFFQSMLYFRSISNSIFLEYPKSFQIISKVNEQYLKERCTFKINVKNIDFSHYEGKKQKKMLAQFRYVLAQITTILEIDEAQRLFCMGSELNDLIRCLRVSPMKQLKLNFYLDEIDPQHFHYINAFIKQCPPELQFLQIQLEATQLITMNLQVDRRTTLKAFSYSYFQKIYQNRHIFQVAQEQILQIDNQFLILDRYNFERFTFEIAGNLNLQNCPKLFENFKEMKAFKISLNNNAKIQDFKFQDNIKSNKLQDLDVHFENIRIYFQSFPFHNLKTFKITLQKCEFNKIELYNILNNLRAGESKIIFIDMSQCDSKFNKMEKTELLRVLEQHKFDVTIII